MKPDVVAFLSWANDRWTEQRFNLLETPAQFAAREPAWFLKDLAREWKAHRKALFAALKPERAKLETRCVKLGDAIGLAVADVRKHRYRPTYGDCPTDLRDGGKLSRSRLRATRTRTNRESNLIKDLTTFSDSWSAALARFTRKPLACAPIEALGFPLESREVPDLNLILAKDHAVRSWPWGGLYPARLLKLWAIKGKWPDETPWPILVWGDAFDRMLTQLGQLHSVAATSPWSVAMSLDHTLGQPSLAEHLGLPESDETGSLSGWQLQLQGQYKAWLLSNLGSGNAKRVSQLYPVGLHPIKWHRSPDGRPFLAPMASSLQATIWFVGYLLRRLAIRPLPKTPPSTGVVRKRRKPPKDWDKHAESILDTGVRITVSALAKRVGVARSTVWRRRDLRARCIQEPRSKKGFKRDDGKLEAYDDE